MARYSVFLGRKVEVQYRAGDILLPASGTFVADSGRSIFLEQNLELRGQHKHFRWEIPYGNIHSIANRLDAEVAAEGVDGPVDLRARAAAAASGPARSDTPSILPLSQPTKTA